jgi:anti-sigma B factor antagonist
MTVNVADRGDVAVVAIVGSIDATTAPQLSDVLDEQIRRGRVKLVGDLTGVDYTSSAGLRALLASLKDSRTGGGDLRLVGARSNVHKVLEMSGFTSILKSYPNVDQAVASFGE